MGLWGDRQEPVDAATWIDAALPRLMGAALSLTGHRQDAEDLLQETLAKVILKWSSVNHADSPDAYVRRAMVNTFISGKRRKSSREVVSHDVVTDERRAVRGDGHDSDIATRDHMWQLLATLPPRQRAVLVLRYYDDLPDAQIAEVLGCSAVSVRVAAHRAMGTLRGALTEAGTDVPAEAVAERT